MDDHCPWAVGYARRKRMEEEARKQGVPVGAVGYARRKRMEEEARKQGVPVVIKRR